MPKQKPTAHQQIRREILSRLPGLGAAETLFDSVKDVLFCVKDRNGRYVAVNETFLRLTGFAHRSSLLGRTAAELFPAILAAGYEQQDTEVFRKGIAIQDRLEMITRPRGGIGWFVTQKVPVKDPAGEILALASISRDLHLSEAAGREIGPLGEALDKLHTEFAQPLRIAELARMAGLSASQFQRRVSTLTGLTPRQLLTKARISAAAETLRATDRPIGEIALDCGFYDQAALSRYFRSATGLTPGAYRRLANEGM